MTDKPTPPAEETDGMLQAVPGSLSSVEPRRVDDILIPADYSFAAVNEFVHHPEVSYEELQWAMLGMASGRIIKADQLKEIVACLQDGRMQWIMWAHSWQRDRAYGNGQPEIHPTHAGVIARFDKALTDLGHPPENVDVEARGK